jgi:magnesium-dependent phosphatase 1
VPEILSHLLDRQDTIAASASRTHAPKMAQKMLDLLHIEGQPASVYLESKVWGIGSKIAHFRELKKITGIAFKDMVFFDDESRNRDVEHQLGVTFVLVEQGLSWPVYREGIQQWTERNCM